jgi:hypothetical protein
MWMQLQLERWGERMPAKLRGEGFPDSKMHGLCQSDTNALQFEPGIVHAFRLAAWVLVLESFLIRGRHPERLQWMLDPGSGLPMK